MYVGSSFEFRKVNGVHATYEVLIRLQLAT